MQSAEEVEKHVPIREGDYGERVAMAVGLVVSVWLFSNTALYIGVVATAHPEVGDITFIVGFLITAALYYAFNLNLGKQTADKRAAMGSRAA